MSDDDSGSFIDDSSLNDFSDFSGGEGQVRGLYIYMCVAIRVWDESEGGSG